MLDYPVTETVLDNGLKVLLVEHRAAPITTVWTFYRVGSRNERPGITGISHWTEHMCFKGGREFGKGDIFKTVSRVGGYNNGMTSTDFTCYFETVPAAEADLGLRIEADRMAYSRFDPDEVASERSVIISEREGAENFPQFLLMEETALAAFRTHPYRWSIVGWKADLREITAQELVSHYRDCYAPGNAVLLVVGDFESKQMLARVRELYGGFSGEARVPQVRSVEPPQEGERRFYLRRPGNAAYLDVAFHIPEARHPDAPALRVLNSILSGTGPIAWLAPGAGGVKTSRLYKALVDSGLASAAFADVTPSQIDPALGQFLATVRVGVEPERVEEALLRLVEEAVSAPPTAEEMERARTQLEAAIAYAGESATGVAALLGIAEMSLGYEQVARLPEQIAAVTAEDVLRVAQTYLTESNRTIGWLIPTEGGGAGAAGEGASPAAFRRFFYTGVEMFRQARRRTLDNGLRVVACSVPTTPSVAIAGAIAGGGLYDTPEQAGRARFAATMLDRGTAGRSANEIALALDGIGATFSASTRLETLQFTGNCLSSTLPGVLDLAADVVTRPSFPEAECEKVRTEILTSLRESADSTREVAMKGARQLLYPAGHPYNVWEQGESETVAALQRGDLAGYHREAVRPDRAFLILVGDAEPEETLARAAQQFSHWQAEGEPRQFDLRAVPPDQIRTRCFPMPGKTQCDLIIAAPGLPRMHEHYLPFNFAITVLGQLGFMGRLGRTVRDELGLAYYAYAANFEARGDAMWFAQAGVNPKNVQLAIDTMLAQMRLMQQELISEEEYADLQANKLGALAMLAETKAKLAQGLLNLEIFGLGEDYYDRYPDLVRAVTREQILEAARTYFRPDAHVRVVAGPECGA